MLSEQSCPECGAAGTTGQTCTEYFHTMGAWELDHQIFDVHHMMVICYHLQHPSLYSPEALQGAKHMLVEFLENGVSPQAMRQKISSSVDSSKRTYKIKGTPESYGSYAHPIEWTMRAADVVQGSVANYRQNILQWAKSVLNDLRESSNLASDSE